MAYLYGEASPPELRLGQNCQGWNVLPIAGGYLDQDYRTITGMNIALNTYNVVTKVKGSKGKDIHKLSDMDRRMLKPLIDRGLI